MKTCKYLEGNKTLIQVMHCGTSYVARTRVQVSDAGVNPGVGHLKSESTGYADMDPDLDTGAGIRQIIIFVIIFLIIKIEYLK